MRRSEFVGSILLALILAWPWSLWGANLQEAQTDIAQLDVAPTRIDWLPQLDSERSVLTVSGPGDLFIRREFESGKAPVLTISDPEWDHLPDGSYTWELRVIPPANKLPQRPLVSSGHFAVKDGSFVSARRKAPAGAPRPPRLLTAETSFVDADLAVEGNACIGTSCTINDADYPSLKLMGPQPNILFDDDFVEESTSSTNDWAVFINPSTAAEFSIADVTNTLVPFTLIGGAPTSSLYVAGNGNLGLGTATPAKDVHVMSGNTPTVRLEQDASGSLSPRTWDLGADQTELFIKDVTNSSSLPFRIKAGAPTSSLSISASGNVGIGTASPNFNLHVSSSGSGGTDGKVLVQNSSGTSAARELLEVRNANGAAQIVLKDGEQTPRWVMTGSTTWSINNTAHAGVELQVNPDGALLVNGTTMTVPDYVFDPNYELRPLSELAAFVREERHLPNVPSAAEIKRDGLNLSAFPAQLLEKIEELALYTIEQHKQIEGLAAENSELKARLTALEEQMKND